MDESKFDGWLKKKFGYIDKSARDVRSRVKRANQLADVTSEKTDEEVLFYMSQNPEFKELSPSVKSQLKRGVKLYREFVRETNGEYNTNNKETS